MIDGDPPGKSTEALLQSQLGPHMQRMTAWYDDFRREQIGRFKDRIPVDPTLSPLSAAITRAEIYIRETYPINKIGVVLGQLDTTSVQGKFSPRIVQHRLIKRIQEKVLEPEMFEQESPSIQDLMQAHSEFGKLTGKTIPIGEQLSLLRTAEVAEVQADIYGLSRRLSGYSNGAEGYPAGRIPVPHLYIGYNSLNAMRDRIHRATDLTDIETDLWSAQSNYPHSVMTGDLLSPEDETKKHTVHPTPPGAVALSLGRDFYLLDQLAQELGAVTPGDTISTHHIRMFGYLDGIQAHADNYMDIMQKRYRKTS